MRGRNSREQQETVAGVLAGLLPPQAPERFRRWCAGRRCGGKTAAARVYCRLGERTRGGSRAQAPRSFSVAEACLGARPAPLTRLRRFPLNKRNAEFNAFITVLGFAWLVGPSKLQEVRMAARGKEGALACVGAGLWSPPGCRTCGAASSACAALAHARRCASQRVGCGRLLAGPPGSQPAGPAAVPWTKPNLPRAALAQVEVEFEGRKEKWMSGEARGACVQCGRAPTADHSCRRAWCSACGCQQRSACPTALLAHTHCLWPACRREDPKVPLPGEQRLRGHGAWGATRPAARRLHWCGGRRATRAAQLHHVGASTADC